MKNYNVFISYSSTDMAYAQKVVEYLEYFSLRCFVSYRDMPKGVVWAKAIVEALEESEMLIVIFSDNFNLSDQVDRELEIVVEEKKPILIFKVTDEKFQGAKKIMLPGKQTIEAYQDFEGALKSLVNNVSKLLGFELNKLTRSIKFYSDVCCRVYIDDKYQFTLEAQSLKVIELPIGEYNIEVYSVLHKPACHKEKVTNVTHSIVLIQLKEKERQLTRLSGIELQLFQDENGKYGYKDSTSGKVIIKPDYSWGSSFYNYDFTEVELDNSYYGCIDRSGEIFIPFDKPMLSILENEYIAFQDSEFQLYGLLDKCGKLLILPAYTDIIAFGSDTFQVQRNGKYGIIDEMGKEIINCVYDYNFYFDGNERSITSKQCKWGIIDRAGTEIVTHQYDEMKYMGEKKLIAVEMNKKWGCVNWVGEVFIPIMYDEIDKIGSFYRIKTGHHYGVVKYNNEFILPQIYDKIFEMAYEDKLSEGEYFNVCINANWEVLDRDGKWLRNGISKKSEIFLEMEKLDNCIRQNQL